MTEESVVSESAALPKFASFNSRLAASSIDVGVVILFAVPLCQIFQDHLFAPIDANAFTAMVMAIQEHPDRAFEAFFAFNREQHMLLRAFFENLFQAACLALYTIPFWLRYSTTPGKMLFGLEIRDSNTGDRMTKQQAVIRFLGYFVSGIPLTLGFVWTLFNKKRQCWHDMMAHTVVTVKPKKIKEPVTEAAKPPLA